MDRLWGQTFSHFPQALALIGPLCFRQILEIILSGDLLISVHGKVVPDPEVLRNIDAMRAGHTVSAARTAILRSGLDGSGNSLTIFSSFSVRGSKLPKVFRLSSTCSIVDIPLNTTWTSGWDATQRRAQEEVLGLRLGLLEGSFYFHRESRPRDRL